MRIHSKLALGVLVLSVICSVRAARGAQENPPPPDDPQGPVGPGPGDPMRSMGPPNFARRDGGMRGRRDDGRPGNRDGRWGRGGGMGRDIRGRGFGPRGPRLAALLSDPNIRQQVGVSADQVAKIRQQESDFRKAEIRDRADLETKRIDLRDLLSADQPDRSAIDSKLQEISAAQLALEKAAVDYRLNMRDALTPAQRDKLRQLLAQRRGPGAGGNGGPRGPRAGGPGQRRAAPAPNPQSQSPAPAPNQQPNR